MKLKPCPFCGGEAYMFFDDRLYRCVLCGVACSRCGALVHLRSNMSEKLAIKTWNTRYEPPSHNVEPAENVGVK